MKNKKKKAIALYSGGLDSILAIKLILEQDIKVVGLYCRTPFLQKQPDLHYLEQYLNIPLIIEDIAGDFQEILINPKYGFGKNKNPCIDCRILMFKKAGSLMIKENASFIISGEVLGQRPMSQNKRSLLLISDKSGYGEFILRPLSALLLPMTEPERNHIIDRCRLMDIHGRSRKRQIALAKQWGIKDYPAPAGGCKLTEPSFADRIKDLLCKPEYVFNDIELLKIGRHFNINKFVRLVVGRNEKENKIILSLANYQDYLLNSYSHKGPLSLLRCYGNWDDRKEQFEEILTLAGKITARYCDKEKNSSLVDINVWRNKKIIRKFKELSPLSEQLIDFYLI